MIPLNYSTCGRSLSERTFIATRRTRSSPRTTKRAKFTITTRPSRSWPLRTSPRETLPTLRALLAQKSCRRTRLDPKPMAKGGIIRQVRMIRAWHVQKLKKKRRDRSKGHSQTKRSSHKKKETTTEKRTRGTAKSRISRTRSWITKSTLTRTASSIKILNNFSSMHSN